VQNYPIVFIDRNPGIPCNFVAYDGFSGMNKLAKYALGCGHKSFAAVNTPNFRIVDERSAGLMQAFREAGIPDGDVTVYKLKNPFRYFADDKSELYAFFDIVAAKPKPCCLICCNDMIAVLAIEYMRGKNIRVPEEISVGGYDDAVYAANESYSLTTCRQKFSKIGEEAAKIILSVIRNKFNCYQSVYLRPDLVVRKSIYNHAQSISATP
jgi:DNA-binding LacI/PurR family transcriptional regulator